MIKIKRYKKGKNNKKSRKLVPKRCLAYELFLKGTTSVDVAIKLNLDFDKDGAEQNFCN